MKGLDEAETRLVKKALGFTVTVTVTVSATAGILLAVGLNQVGAPIPGTGGETVVPRSPAYGEIPCPAGYTLLVPPTGPAAVDGNGANTLTLCQSGNMRLRLVEDVGGIRQWVSFNLATGLEELRPDLPVGR